MKSCSMPLCNRQLKTSTELKLNACGKCLANAINKKIFGAAEPNDTPEALLWIAVIQQEIKDLDIQPSISKWEKEKPVRWVLNKNNVSLAAIDSALYFLSREDDGIFSAIGLGHEWLNRILTTSGFIKHAHAKRAALLEVINSQYEFLDSNRQIAVGA